MASPIFSRTTMEMQAEPTDQIVQFNLFSLILEFLQHPWNFITQIGLVSSNLLLSVLEVLLSVFEVQSIADRMFLHKGKSDFTIVNISNEVCLPFLDPITFDSNEFNCDDPVEIKVIVERHNWIAEHRGSSFEFSISVVLTQGKSEIQNWATRWIIVTLQWIIWTLASNWHRESRSRSNIWNVPLSKRHAHDENIL